MWYQGKSNKERYMEKNEKLEAERERWLNSFGKNEGDVYTDDKGDEYVIAEIDREPINDDDPSMEINRVKLPEEIQSKNIEL
jgi:hypothetical protein